MVYKDTSQSTVSGFDLAWFSSVVEAPLCLWSSWCYIDIKFFLLTSFSLPFSELSLVGLAQGSPGWLTIFLQCYDAVGWVMWPGPLGIPGNLALPNSRREFLGILRKLRSVIFFPVISLFVQFHYHLQQSLSVNYNVLSIKLPTVKVKKQK